MSSPFVMIFSIIIIVFVISFSFIVFRPIFGVKCCAEINLLVTDFQGKIDDMWQAQSGDDSFSASLPCGLEKICFINISMPAAGENGNLFDEVKMFIAPESNFVFYPPTKACESPDRKIKHINLEMLKENNPYCLGEKSKVEISLEKGFYDSLVKIE
jgi:hypothetical protein